MPDLEQSIHQVYDPELVRVVGVHPAEEPGPMLADFREQTGITFRMIPDPTGSLFRFAFPSGVEFPYPRDVVVDKHLTVRSIKNSFDADELQALIEELLAE